MNAAYRQLYIYSTLTMHQTLEKSDLAKYFEVSPRTIQRDVSQLNSFFVNENIQQSIEYSRTDHNYYIVNGQGTLSDKQLLVIIKMLLATRGLNLEEMTDVVNGLQDSVKTANKFVVRRMVQNELVNFMPLNHNRKLVDMIWNFANFIVAQKTVKIQYVDQQGKATERNIIPLAIHFSEDYFYVVANDQLTHSERFFRTDRIMQYVRVHTEERDPRAEKFTSAKLREQVQFMYTGKMEQITFEYWGVEEAALDRLPNAKVIERHDNSVIISTTAYVDGVKMWFLSQGPLVSVLAPDSLVTNMRNSLQEMGQRYGMNLK